MHQYGYHKADFYTPSDWTKYNLIVCTTNHNIYILKEWGGSFLCYEEIKSE